MTAWVLTCRNCKGTFLYTTIGDRLLDLIDPRKPEMSAEGEELVCPNCGERACTTVKI
jgi:Trm112p-like protein